MDVAITFAGGAMYGLTSVVSWGAVSYQKFAQVMFCFDANHLLNFSRLYPQIVGQPLDTIKTRMQVRMLRGSYSYATMSNYTDPCDRFEFFIHVR